MTSLVPSVSALDLSSVAAGTGVTGGSSSRRSAARDARMHGQAQDFEVQFVNSMFQHMYTGLDGDGPFGNSTGVGPWRSFLTEEFAKSFVKSGGIGIADSVYKSLLAVQEARQR
jgi:flagellar protein FlgJ